MKRSLSILLLLVSPLFISGHAHAADAATIAGKCFVNTSPYRRAIALAVKQHFIANPVTGIRAVKAWALFKRTSPTEVSHRTSDEVLGTDALFFPVAEGADALNVALSSTSLPAAPACSMSYTVTVVTSAITETGEIISKKVNTENVSIPGTIR